MKRVVWWLALATVGCGIPSRGALNQASFGTGCADGRVGSKAGQTTATLRSRCATAVCRAWASHEDGRGIRGDTDFAQLQCMQAANLPGPTIRTREVTPVPETVLALLRAVSLQPPAPAGYIDPATWCFTRDGQTVEWKVRGPESFQRAWDELERLNSPE